MFTDSGPAAATRESSRHHQLLWALERLAWSPDHFGRVTGLLARLAEIDPGGRMRNRPFNSLVTILSLQYPETSASATARMAVIERLRERHPDIAWQLMMALLPSQLAIHYPTPEPGVPRLEAAGARHRYPGRADRVPRDARRVADHRCRR